MLMVKLRSFPVSCASGGLRSKSELRDPGTLIGGDDLESKRLRRWIYGRAKQQTARPDRRSIVPSWLLSSCLISALTLSEDPGLTGTYD